MRLAKYLAHGGVASRRASERIVADGRVTVGGEVVTDPAREVGDADDVRVDGRPVSGEPREVWALNKPAGVVSTAREPGSRKAVVELVASRARLYPVGRLDADSTGLILLTNDGELANRLTHPRYGVAKTYVAELRRPPAERDLGRLAEGLRLDDGPTAPARVSPARRAPGRGDPARGPKPAGAEDVRGDRERGARRCAGSGSARSSSAIWLRARAAGSTRTRSSRLWEDARP